MWIVELTKLNSSSNLVFHSIFRKLRKNETLKAKIGNIKFLLEIMKPAKSAAASDLYSQLLGRMKRKDLWLQSKTLSKRDKQAGAGAWCSRTYSASIPSTPGTEGKEEERGGRERRAEKRG